MTPKLWDVTPEHSRSHVQACHAQAAGLFRARPESRWSRSTHRHPSACPTMRALHRLPTGYDGTRYPDRSETACMLVTMVAIHFPASRTVCSESFRVLKRRIARGTRTGRGQGWRAVPLCAVAPSASRPQEARRRGVGGPAARPAAPHRAGRPQSPRLPPIRVSQSGLTRTRAQGALHFVRLGVPGRPAGPGRPVPHTPAGRPARRRPRT